MEFSTNQEITTTMNKLIDIRHKLDLPLTTLLKTAIAGVPKQAIQNLYSRHYHQLPTNLLKNLNPHYPWSQNTTNMLTIEYLRWNHVDPSLYPLDTASFKNWLEFLIEIWYFHIPEGECSTYHLSQHFASETCDPSYTIKGGV